MAQAKQYPVQRPAGFHWDFLLLGATTFVAGLLGLPAVNGLVPQCPIHTESLCVQKVVPRPPGDHEKGGHKDGDDSPTSTHLPSHQVSSVRLVEQRLDHFIVGLLTIGTMTRPLLVVLCANPPLLGHQRRKLSLLSRGLMPRAVFAGVFILVGWASVEGNPITHRTLYLLRDQRMTPPNHPLKRVRRRQIAKFLAVQWFVAGSTIAISQTIAAIGFPIIFIAMIPFRHYVMPGWFRPEELIALDAPTASADCVFVSLGGDPASDKTE